MIINQKLLTIENKPAKQFQRNSKPVCSFAGNSSVITTAANAAVSTGKFVTGNIFAGYFAVLLTGIAKPVLFVAEKIEKRATGLNQLKDAYKKITPAIRETYAGWGVPKSGEFLTQPVEVVAKKAGNFIKNLFTNISVEQAAGKQKQIAARKTEAYQIYGSSEGAKFVTQLVKDIVKKAGNLLKNLFKK